MAAYTTRWPAGRANGAGSVFKLAADTHALGTLATFTVPYQVFNVGFYGGLLFDANGKLLGTTTVGFLSNYHFGFGIVFEVVAATNMLCTLASFNGTNWSEPRDGLTAGPRR